ncbi:MAG TPA: DUF5627 domain-containing protein [Bacteroidales bacterium]|nr:DUF5627 domain-containing protein [Bacteroidales bacterium]HPM18768.1 DUF5627 domain-containing protein [Bacteroidales bacterium]HQM69108.1 DUF5627 domain-containing protein [Bacteroidales bacterium]
MKKLLIILALVTGLIACENWEQKFDDYNFTGVYFPYQYPVRTLVLGDDIYPNENDNNHMCIIYAAFGGVYENKFNRVVNFTLDQSLCNSVRFGLSAGDTVRLMPTTYYTLSSNSSLTIPKGEFMGGVEVHLTDAFFNDPMSVGINYVIPLRITGTSDVDSVLSGRTSKESPDRRVAGDWDVLPKDFTMYAVKFVNPWHGHYLHRGVTVTKEIAPDTVVNTQVQHQKFIEKDEVWTVSTSGKNKVTYSGTLRSNKLSGDLKMDLTFDANNNCVISDAGSAFPVSGTGKFVKNAESWGNKDRNVIYLTYTATDGTYSLTANDTLVVRDRGTVLQTYNPVILTK